MSKKKIIVFICITVSILAIVIIAGLMIISPTPFSEKEDATDEDKPQIAEDIEGLELIGSEEELSSTEIVLDNEKEESSQEKTFDEYWDEHLYDIGLLEYDEDGNLVPIDEGEYMAHEEEIFDDSLELEEPVTETIFRISNPAYLSGETNLGTNGFHNFYECMEDYLDYYFPENAPKEYEGTVVEGSYKDKGDYRSFRCEVYPNYPDKETVWLIECDYVVSMNYYEFFCDDINPRPKTGED